MVALVGALAGHAEDVADVGPGGAGGAGLVDVVRDEVFADPADLPGDLGCGSEPVELGARGAPVADRLDEIVEFRYGCHASSMS